MKKLQDSELYAALEDLEQAQIQETQRYEAENVAWWNSLSTEEREHAFYAVVKRLHQGEVVQDSSYRHILYTIFGFGPHMYARGMDCGYLELHNAIYNSKEVSELRSARRNKDMTKLLKTTDVILRIDGGAAGVYYAENEQQYYEAITKLEALGANIAIEKI